MKVLLQDIKKLETEAVIVGFFEDVRPLKGIAGALDWLLCGSLSRLITGKKIRGAVGDIALLTSRDKIPAPKIFMVGLGPRKGLTPETVKTAARKAAVTAVGAGVSSAAFDWFSSSGELRKDLVVALRDGVQEGARGARFEVALLASDTASFEKYSRFIGTA